MVHLGVRQVLPADSTEAPLGFQEGLVVVERDSVSGLEVLRSGGWVFNACRPK